MRKIFSIFVLIILFLSACGPVMKTEPNEDFVTKPKIAPELQIPQETEFDTRPEVSDESEIETKLKTEDESEIQSKIPWKKVKSDDMGMIFEGDQVFSGKVEMFSPYNEESAVPHFYPDDESVADFPAELVNMLKNDTFIRHFRLPEGWKIPNSAENKIKIRATKLIFQIEGTPRIEGKPVN